MIHKTLIKGMGMPFFSRSTDLTDHFNMEEVFRRHRYLPVNVALLIIAGLYSFKIKNNILKTIYFLWRVSGLIVCTTFIAWITAGLIESGSFELEKSAPAILHLCNCQAN